jgi:hypothetical protein
MLHQLFEITDQFHARFRLRGRTDKAATMSSKGPSTGPNQTEDRASGERDGVIRDIFNLSKDTVLYTGIFSAVHFVFRKRIKSILLVDYSCALHSKLFYGGGVMHGRMYITNAHLCFYSNLFGFEKKVKLG